ncbi:hypothetical protein FDECE_13845 [Fusarium decemcellulare]|nr:hypothetical protein FDECE_13845 [Fusarium decemcellulare]
MSYPRPSRRDDFEVAIICALPLEYDAISYAFDEFWDDNGDQYGRAPGDPNSYTTGRVGKYNVVLALLPHMGKVNAASAAASMRSSYSSVRLALLVGICGGLPFAQHGEILLGDVIVSKTVIQYDFGRLYPDKFSTKSTTEDNLGRPSKDVRSLVATFETDRGREQLEQLSAHFLEQLRGKAAQRHRQGKYDYPGTALDKLFKASYRHKHHTTSDCICRDCHTDSDPVCDKALGLSCDDLGCSERHLVARNRLQMRGQSTTSNQKTAPHIALHVGAIASTDMVIKSATDRDKISKLTGAIAFEMEGAGIWDEVPCIVVKGVCDYADSHKAKGWQNYAAATATSAAKAILGRYIQTDKVQREYVSSWHYASIEILDNTDSNQDTPTAAQPQSSRAFSTIPFPPDPKFVERADILSWIRDRVAYPGGRAALVGLGGMGKSQIAIDYAHQVRQASPMTYVFWVHASSRVRFEEAYRTIANRLQLRGRDDPKCNVLQLVHSWLIDEKNGPWMMVVDNADSEDVFFSIRGSKSQPLASFLPKAGPGWIVFTSRNKTAARRLAGPGNSYHVSNMTQDQALQLLCHRLDQEYDPENSSMTELVEALDCIPLVINHAAAHIRQKGPHKSVSTCLKELQGNDKNKVDLLGRKLVDLRRDDEAPNSVISTWQTTFEQIRYERPSVMELLPFVCFLKPQGIPKCLLRAYHCSLEGEHSVEKDLKILLKYSLIAFASEQDVFNMHPLVQLCTRTWLSSVNKIQQRSKSGRHQQSKDDESRRQTLLRLLVDQYPPDPEDHQSWSLCRQLDPQIDVILGKEPRDRKDFKRWARLLHHSGIHRQLMGKYQKAEQIHRQCLEARRRVLGLEHLDTLKSLYKLGVVLWHQSKYEESAQLNRQCLEARQRLLGEDHPDTTRSLNNVAVDLYTQGKYDEAERLNRQCLEMRLRVLGEDHEDTLKSMNNLALVLNCQGKSEESARMLQRTLEVRERVLGREHPDTLRSVNDLAWSAWNQDRFTEAGELFQRAHSGFVSVLGSNHPETQRCLKNWTGMAQAAATYVYTVR